MRFRAFADFEHQAKEAGLNATFWGGGDPFDDPAFIEAAKGSAEGFVFPSVTVGDRPFYSQFENEFQSTYGKAPSIFSAYAYDTAQVVLYSLRSCGASSERIRDCLYSIDFNGVTNRIRFDANGDLVGGRVVFKKIENGQIVTIGESPFG
ncbi:MAG: ABC transporter substrate-binding protein [Candidatus Diapherotrites archaeon]